jgi:hypothetical protein
LFQLSRPPESLILKTILWEGFSGPVLRPWAVHAQRGPATTIVGYTQIGAGDLNKHRALALPSVQTAIGEPMAVPLPSLSRGERYRFAIRLVPIIRVTKAEGRRHGERDAFLAQADIAGKDAGLKRDDIYRSYLAERVRGRSPARTQTARSRATALEGRDKAANLRTECCVNACQSGAEAGSGRASMILDRWPRYTSDNRKDCRFCAVLCRAFIPIVHCRSGVRADMFLAQVPVDFIAAVRHLKAFLQPSALDDEIADLGKPHMRGPMWSSGTSTAEREGSRTEGLRQQHRPYRADAAMTAVVELAAGSPVVAADILSALDQPVDPLFIGRSSCPPASRLCRPGSFDFVFDIWKQEVRGFDRLLRCWLACRRLKKGDFVIRCRYTQSVRADQLLPSVRPTCPVRPVNSRVARKNVHQDRHDGDERCPLMCRHSRQINEVATPRGSHQIEHAAFRSALPKRSCENRIGDAAQRVHGQAIKNKK